MKREKVINWVEIDPKNPQTIPFQIKKTQIFLQDLLVDLDDLTELENDTLFKF